MSEVWLDPGSHGVRFYESGPGALDSIAEFFTAEAGDDDALLLISRRSTFESVVSLLASGRYGPPVRAERIHFVDAHEALGRIVHDGVLDPVRTHTMLVQLLAEIRGRHASGTIRAFGEMVDVLCETGAFDSAVALEGIWSGLFLVEPQMAVLCGYALSRFREGANAVQFHAICGRHTHCAAPSGTGAVPRAPGMPPGLKTSDGKPPSIVYVIDDDASLRRSLERLLSLAEYRVATFESAEAFLAVLDHLPQGCSVVDIQLGAMSGLELLERLGAARPGWPAIAMSGSHNESAEKESLRLGARVFLRKPFDPQSLLDAIARAFA